MKVNSRLVIPIKLLFHASKDAEVDKRNIKPWLGDKNSGSRDGDVPSLFSE